LNKFFAAFAIPSTIFLVREVFGGASDDSVVAIFFPGDFAGRSEVFFLADMGAGFSFITANPRARFTSPNDKLTKPLRRMQRDFSMAGAFNQWGKTLLVKKTIAN
jgi:hypothetical protein